jgi:RNA polymerase sigma-70 factor (ECF subfamily)
MRHFAEAGFDRSRVSIRANTTEVLSSAAVELAPGESDELARRDAELARLLRADPHAAAATLYERYSPQVNRWVWRLMGADPDHSDIVQHVFLTVLREGRRLREVDRLAAWVRMITVNTVYDELRKRDVRRIFQRSQRDARAHADLVRDVEAREILMKTKAVLDKMPAKERIVFALYFFEHQTLGQIAELLGYSRATAKRRLHDASARFQRLARATPELLKLFEPKVEQP